MATPEMNDPKSLWMNAARDSLMAAMTLVNEHPRSAASRAYYAAFAAAHAALLHAGEHPRADLGTWAHIDLPVALRSVLSRTKLPATTAAAKTCQRLLQRCYDARVQADYVPAIHLDAAQSRGVCRDAARIVHVVRRLLA